MRFRFLVGVVTVTAFLAAPTSSAQQLSNPSMTVYSGLLQPEMLHLNESGQAVGYHYYYYVLYGDEVIGFLWQKQKWIDHGGNHRRENIGLSSGFLNEQPGHKWYVSDIVGIADDGSVFGAVRDTLNSVNTVQYFIHDANDESFLLIDDENSSCESQSLKLTAVSPNGNAIGYCQIGDNFFPGVEVSVDGTLNVSTVEYGNSYGLNEFNESIESTGICSEDVCEDYPEGFAPGLVEYSRGTTPRFNGGINVHGVVAGVAGANAALADNGSVVVLDLPAGYQRAVALDVNDNGAAAGYAVTALGHQVAAYWPDEVTMIDLNAVFYADRPEPVLVRVDDINNAGDMVAAYHNGTTWHAQFITGSIPTTPPPPPPYLLAAISAQNFQSSESVGDPVNLFTGELYMTQRPDLFLDGPLPISFDRYYSSALGTTGALGANWRHTYEWRTRPTFNDRSVIDNRGRVHTFVQIAPGEWVNRDVPWIVQEFQAPAQEDRPFTLLETNGGFEFVDSRDGVRRFFDYDSGNLVKIQDRHGNALTLEYADTLLTSVHDSHGRELTFTHDGAFISSVSDGARTVQYEQTGCRLTSSTSPSGLTTTYQYAPGDADCDALMTTAISPGGAQPTQQTYNDDGAVQTQTQGSSTVLFEYCQVEDFVCFDDIYGKNQPDQYNLFKEARVTDPDGNYWLARHFPEGQLMEVEGPTGYRGFDYSYENAENRVDRSTIYYGSATTSIQRDSALAAVEELRFADNSVLRPDLRAAESGGAPVVELHGVELPNGASESFERDEAGNVTRVIDAEGEEANFEYDSRGLLVSSTDPEGHTTTYGYDAAGMRTTITNARGNTVTLGYDAGFRRTSTTMPDGSEHTRTFDDDDRLIQSTDGRQLATEYVWDDDGRVTSITNPAGETETFEYDDTGRITRHTDATGASETSTYNAFGQIATSIDANGNAANFQYDQYALTLDEGVYLTGLVDPAGNTWAYGRDEFGALSAVTTPLGHTTSFTRDGLGRPVLTTDPIGNSRSYGYDALGNLTSVTDELSSATTYEYDTRGLVTGAELPSGVRTELARDANGRVTSVTAGDVGPWDRTYDAVGNAVAVVDPLGNTTTIEYDAMERMSRVTLPDGTIDIEYDADGRVTRRSFSDGTEFVYQYDAAGRLTETKGLTLAYNAAGLIVESNGIVTTRDPGGRATETQYPTGLVVSTDYDSRDLPTVVSDGLGGSAAFEYDEDGRLTSITRSNGTATRFSSDALGRYIDVVHSAGEDTLAAHLLTRDERGDVIDAVRAVPVATSITNGVSNFSSNAAGRISSFGYDDSGLRIQDSRKDYSWNLAGQLIGSAGASTIAFEHDAYGAITQRTEGGVSVTWRWNYASGLATPAEQLVDEIPVRDFVFGPSGDLLWSVSLADTTRQFYHFDESGNTTVVTDDDGIVVAAFRYDPYGQLIGQDVSVAIPFKWGGRFGVFADDEIYHMRTRSYDAVSGQFLSPDPVDNQIHPYAVHPYIYAMANPIRFVDPVGAEAQNADRGFLDPANVARMKQHVSDGAKAISLYSEYQGTKYSAIAGQIKNLNSMRTAIDGLPPIRQQELARAKRLASMYELRKNLSGKLEKVVKGPSAFRPKVGGTGKVIAGYDQVVAWKGFYDKIEAITDEGNRTQDATVNGLDGPYAEIRRQVKLGLITQEQAEVHLRNLAGSYDEMNAGIADATKFGILTEAAVRFNDAVGGVFLKFPTGWVTRPFTAIGNRIFGDD